MLDTCEKLEAARYEAEQIFAEGIERNFPFFTCYLAIKQMMKLRNLEIPDDIMAFTYGPEYSDKQIINPFAILR